SSAALWRCPQPPASAITSARPARSGRPWPRARRGRRGSTGAAIRTSFLAGLLARGLPLGIQRGQHERDIVGEGVLLSPADQLVVLVRAQPLGRHTPEPLDQRAGGRLADLGHDDVAIGGALLGASRSAGAGRALLLDQLLCSRAGRLLRSRRFARACG